MIRPNFISAEDRLQLERCVRRQREDHGIARRANAVLLLDDGESCTQIAKVLYLDDDTIRGWYKSYREDGWDALALDGWQGGQSRMTLDQEAKLCSWLEGRFCRSAGEIRAHIKSKFGLIYSHPGCLKLLRRLGFEYRKPKALPHVADETKQAEFIAFYEALMTNLPADETVYFADAVYPEHQTKPAFGWVRKGSKPAVKTTSGRGRVNIHGAVCLENFDAPFVEPVTVDGNSAVQLLAKIKANSPTMSAVHVIWDNAAYHRCDAVKKWLARPECRIHLIQLPTHCPHLNPIERLWAAMHAHVTHNHFYATQKQFAEAILHFLRETIPKNWRSFRDQAWNCCIAAVAALVLAGCASLPGQGPNSVDITLNENTTAEDIATRNFSVIALTPAVVRAVGSVVPYNTIGLTLGGGSRDPSGTRIGVGDRLTIRIWESSSEGVFSTADSRGSKFPVVVNDAGEIYVPYVGNLSVSGLGLDAVRARIAQGLEGRVVDPEVTVIMENNGAQTISVGGDVEAPGRFDIPASGMRLLDAVAIAGGSSEATYNTEISVIRGGRIARVRLDDVVRNASNNIWLAPRDTIQIHYKPRSFTAFGAISSQKQQAFQSEMVSLTEALAQSGGLSDNLADESGVFIFRFESSERVKQARGHIPAHGYAQGVPTIYKLDFNSPEAFFLAQSFMIHDKDILYVASAPAVEFRKFVNFIISPFITTGNAAQNLAN